MKIVCSPAGIVDINHSAQGVTDMGNAMFQGTVLDLSLFCQPYELEAFKVKPLAATIGKLILENPECMEDSLCQFVHQCEEKELTFGMAYAPYLPRDTKRTDMNDCLKALAKAAIRMCAKRSCPYIVVRPLFVGLASESLWDVNQAFYMELAELAQQNGIRILLENQCRNIGGHLVRGICSDAKQAVEWIDRLNEKAFVRWGKKELFGFCMNVGVCNLCGQNMYELAHKLGSRICAVVVSDGDGNREAALLPFTASHMGVSSTDWLNLIRGLRDIGFDGILVMDGRDSIAAFSPLLRPQALQLAKAAIEYLEWQICIENRLKQYDARVLFGAGNMCRNYMKCYGKKYPPLFTCDNNASRWGEEFCGLMIESPQKLLELPENTAIFICNIYYREIEAQLRKMGLKNPIEFFNDEYMPSFHFDRIEV